jgi:hypothetical protein
MSKSIVSSFFQGIPMACWNLDLSPAEFPLFNCNLSAKHINFKRIRPAIEFLISSTPLIPHHHSHPVIGPDKGEWEFGRIHDQKVKVPQLSHRFRNMQHRTAAMHVKFGE